MKKPINSRWNFLCTPKLNLKLKLTTLLCIVSFFQMHANDAVQQQISGVITDQDNAPLIGATVLEKGTVNGVQTDFDGKYTLTVNEGSTLVISFIGYKTQEIVVGNQSTINIKMVEDAASLDEVVLVSFGKQKKSSVISSITTVKPEDIRVPSSNLTTGLLGQVSGLTGFQAGGEPGADNAEFFIRGVTTFGYAASPLILIDGVELTIEDLSRLHPDDIAAFSIMKDASATALYGARGANGVIFITTKEGTEGPVKVSARVEYSQSRATTDLDVADPVTYMRMHNEAITTRNPLGVELYSPRKIDNTIAGTNPLLNPVTDWKKELLRDNAITKRMNINLNGGGKMARFYVALAASKDGGILEVPKVSNFNSNIDLKKYSFRSNVNLNLSETTGLKLAFNANYIDYSGPRSGGAAVYRDIVRSNPVLFRPFYEKDEEHQFTNHILFGNFRNGDSPGYRNPYAEMVSGYRESTESKIIAQLEFTQDLKMITEGLSFKAALNVTRASVYNANRSYNPYFYQPSLSRSADGSERIILELLNQEQGTEFLDYNGGERQIEATTYAESRLTYSKNFNTLHDVSGLLVFTLNDRLASIEAGDLQASLPFRNMGLAGRFTYGYDSKYLAEVNFGYNGSERFAKSERFGFFPSFGFGWVVSNEPFMQGKIKDVITSFKIKQTYGLVGNDAIGSAADRFFYLSNVNLNDGSGNYTFGENYNSNGTGVSISRYANSAITWEKAFMSNLGVELKLFNKLDVEVDLFEEYRTNILWQRIVPASLGLEASVLDNIGEAKSSGIDGSLVYSHSFDNSLWVQARANYTYATSEITKLEEPDYTDTPWLSRVGQPINQQWGLVAERLFVDEAEINNAPEQGFGEYAAGDIKYRDINNDGKITDLDKVPIGNQSVPEIVYGFGVSTGYKGFDLSCFFQGQDNRSFWIDPVTTAPFLGGNQVLKVWADDYWSETNRNPYAKWPRLADRVIENNTQRSTWFIQNGGFLRLKNVEIGYTFPEKAVSKFKLEKVRVYATGVNLATWSSFKLWDVEMAGNGLGYPNQKVFNLGIHISL